MAHAWYIYGMNAIHVACMVHTCHMHEKRPNFSHVPCMFLACSMWDGHTSIPMCLQFVYIYIIELRSNCLKKQAMWDGVYLEMFLTTMLYCQVGASDWPQWWVQLL